MKELSNSFIRDILIGVVAISFYNFFKWLTK